MFLPENEGLDVEMKRRGRKQRKRGRIKSTADKIQMEGTPQERARPCERENRKVGVVEAGREVGLAGYRRRRRVVLLGGGVVGAEAGGEGGRVG